MFNKGDWQPLSYKRLQDGDEMQSNDYDSAPEKTTYGMLLLFIMITSMTLNAILVSGGLYFYSKRGPWNPIFPQSLYCKLHHPSQAIKFLIHNSTCTNGCRV